MILHSARACKQLLWKPTENFPTRLLIHPKGLRVSLVLNIPQERELRRLIDYERATCSVEGELVYRCAFPFRPDDELQAELIERGALATKAEGRRGTIVVITSEGYSYFLEKARAERERVRREKRDARLIGFAAVLGAACVVVGFLLGRFVA